jgi:excisionase family DNA binding protein
MQINGRTQMDRLLTPNEVADLLGIPLGTLYRWKATGEGPRRIRVGKHLRFRQRDVDAYLDRKADER